jgi:hypothetical protein
MQWKLFISYLGEFSKQSAGHAECSVRLISSLLNFVRMADEYLVCFSVKENILALSRRGHIIETDPVKYIMI